ncbi:SSI family serine proteinase inhibitor [Streptomyces sp. CT34]|uniref:SSI family serine proteinase inhibitor n=1 Tax=Streptomyces sp. CT34 TaxID=1553907 RepID=UPI0005BBCD8C|nr:SSI family serine proteinase inhibitor [Streptomyces sp. CT34]
MPYRRTSSLFAAATGAATAAVALVSALALAPAAAAAPIPLPDHHSADGLTRAGHHAPAGAHGGHADHLTVTVAHSGSARTDGTFELYCHPARGTRLDAARAARACAELDRMTRWGRDAFAPVPQSARCTMMYGGPATAHVSGTWAGRRVNADFRRTDGCEIDRWGRFEPMLPSTVS